MVRSSEQREQLTEKDREAGRSLIKSTGPKTDFCETPMADSKGTIFVILINHASTPIRKEALSSASKAWRQANRNEFMEKGRMPDKSRKLWRNQ